MAGTGPEATAYSYDLENRLGGATIYRLEGTNTVSITASYLYNPSGIRARSDTQTQINGSPGSPSVKHTFYLVDSMNHTGYAQVLEEWNATGSGTASLDRSYTIGDDVLAQTSETATHYLGYDGHGSTRILTDSSGAIASGARYNYDAYGISMGSPASTLNPSLTSLLYTGEQFDTDLQQYYLRARYYNQNTGRFNQLDPFAGSNFDPQSLHKYCYAHDDPTNGIDPSGEEFTLLELLVVLVLILVLAGCSQSSSGPIKKDSKGVVLTGAEPAYDPTVWNSTSNVTFNNCYAYAVNDLVSHPMRTEKPQPGQKVTGVPPAKTLAAVKAGAEADGLIYLGAKPSDTLSCPSNAYVIALVIATNTDYHWYRHNPDGTWSGKHGPQTVDNIDATGAIMKNPRTQSHNYMLSVIPAGFINVNYSDWGGYFAVPPGTTVKP